MPLYETVMQEKPPVVLDIGTAYTKLGFAVEAFPRKIIPSETILSSNGQTKNIFSYKNNIEFYDQLVDFFQAIFFKYLLVTPKERKIVIVENVYGPTITRDTLAKVLFRHYEVASILFVPSHAMALSTLAVNQGVVIDMGYNETNVMPIFSGIQIIQAFQDQNYGGRIVHEEIKRQLLSEGVGEKLLTENILEDIKVRTCFVTTRKRAKQYLNGEIIEPAPSVKYPVGEGDTIIVSGRVRETAFEIFFEENNDRDNLPHLILKAIMRCPVDVRRSLFENIFVIGGTSIIMGLKARLKEELFVLLNSDNEYKTKITSNTCFKFHKCLNRPNIAAWLGGSLCAGTDLVNSYALSKDTYIRMEYVPDWTTLDTNRLND